MKRSWWRTGQPKQRAQPVGRPTLGQLLRQLVLLALILLVWGGGLFAFLSVTQTSGAAPVAQVVPTNSPSPVPTNPPTLAVTKTRTPTPTKTNTPLPTTTATATVTLPPTATLLPTTEPTPVSAATLPPANTGAISFQRDVQPIFTQICVKCHGGDETKEGLSLKSYAEVMQGSDNGAVIVPGDPSNSLLVDMIQQGKMPKRGPKLLPKQIQAIVDWVQAGAPNN